MSNKEKTMPMNSALGMAAIALVIGAVGGYAIGINKDSGRAPGMSGQADRQAIVDRMPEGDSGALVGERNRSGLASTTSRFAAGMTMVSGEVASLDGSTLTVTLSDGSSKVVVLTSETMVTEVAEIERDTLAEGANVFISAEADESGVLVATMLQIRSEDMLYGAGRGWMAPSPQVE